MNNPDDNRAAFEAWAMQSGWFIGYELDTDDSGEYEYCSVQKCWLAWQAAIEHAKKTDRTRHA